jgi:uncharacterized membrane protein YphA (DoxX/SURF4 family)
MEVFALLVRCALAAVFCVAAVTKLADLDAFRDTLRGFGIRDRAVSPLAIAVPPAELAVASMLLPAATATWAATGAAALIAALTATVVAALAQGRRPDCGCFGTMSATPIGPATVVRNVVLLAAAVFVVVAGPGPSAVAWIGDLASAAPAALGVSGPRR